MYLYPWKYEPDTFYSFRVINEKRSSFESGLPGLKWRTAKAEVTNFGNIYITFF